MKDEFLCVLLCRLKSRERSCGKIHEKLFSMYFCLLLQILFGIYEKGKFNYANVLWHYSQAKVK